MNWNQNLFNLNSALLILVFLITPACKDKNPEVKPKPFDSKKFENLIVGIRGGAGKVSPGVVVANDGVDITVAAFLPEGQYSRISSARSGRTCNTVYSTVGTSTSQGTTSSPDDMSEIGCSGVDFILDSSSLLAGIKIDSSSMSKLNAVAIEDFPIGKHQIHLVWVTQIKNGVNVGGGAEYEAAEKALEEIKEKLAKTNGLLKEYDDLVASVTLGRTSVQRVSPSKWDEVGGEGDKSLEMMSKFALNRRYPHLKNYKGLPSGTQNKVLEAVESFLIQNSRHKELDLALKTLVKPGDTYKTSFESIDAVAVVKPDRVFEIEGWKNLVAKVDSKSVVATTKDGKVLGLLQLVNQKGKESGVSVSMVSVADRLDFSVVDPMLRLVLSSGVKVECFAKICFGAVVDHVKFRCGPLSETSLETLPNGDLKLVSNGSRKLSDSWFSRPNGIGLKSNSSVSLRLPRNGEGVFQFRGQVYAFDRHQNEIVFPPFVFSITKSNSKYTAFEIADNSWVKKYEIELDKKAHRTVLVPKGRIQSISKTEKGQTLCVHTDASLIQFIDLSTRAWLSDRELKIGNGAHVTSGAAGVFVYYPELQVIEKWDPKTGERLSSKILEIKGDFWGMAAPDQNASSPLFIVTENGGSFIDSSTLSVISFQLSKRTTSLPEVAKWLNKEQIIVSASGDGTVYSVAFDERQFVSLEFYPDLDKKYLNTSKLDRAMVLGNCGSIFYNKANITSNLESMKYSKSDIFYPDTCYSGLIAARKLQSDSYLPSVPATIWLYAEGDHGFTAQEIPVSFICSFGSVPELANQASKGLSVWERGLLSIEHGVFIAVPPSQNEIAIYHREFSKEIEGENPCIITKPPPYLVPDTLFEQEIHTIGNVSDIELIDGPDGAIFSKDNRLTWEVPAMAKESQATFTFELATPGVESRVVEFSIPIKAPPVMKVHANNGVAPIMVPGRYLVLRTRPNRVFKAGGGRYICVVYQGSPMLDVFDLKTESKHFSITLNSSNIEAVANLHSIYLLDREQKILERISLDDPFDRSHTKILGANYMGVSPYSEGPLITFERIVSESRVAGALDLYDPQSLSQLKIDYTDDLVGVMTEIAHGSNSSSFSIVPVSPNGKFARFRTGVLEFQEKGGFKLTKPTSHWGLLSNSGYHDIKIANPEGWKFKPLSTSNLFFAVKGHRLVIYSYTNNLPILIMDNLKELGYKSECFVCPRVNKLVSLDSEFNTLVVRDLDFKKCAKHFGLDEFQF